MNNQTPIRVQVKPESFAHIAEIARRRGLYKVAAGRPSDIEILRDVDLTAAIDAALAFAAAWIPETHGLK